MHSLLLCMGHKLYGSGGIAWVRFETKRDQVHLVAQDQPLLQVLLKRRGDTLDPLLLLALLLSSNT